MSWIPKIKKPVQPKYKYFVKTENDVMPFGKYKGKTLAQLEGENVGKTFKWYLDNKLFGQEEFHTQEVLKILHAIYRSYSSEEVYYEYPNHDHCYQSDYDRYGYLDGEIF